MSNKWFRIEHNFKSPWMIEWSPIPPRDSLKGRGFDLWSGFAFNIGRTHKALIYRDHGKEKQESATNGMFKFDFDSHGRVVMVSYTGDRWGEISFDNYKPEMHRLLSGTWIEGRWEHSTNETGLNYHPTIMKEGDKIYDVSMGILDELVYILEKDQVKALDIAGRDHADLLEAIPPVKNHEGLLKESARLHSIIGGQIPVMPPQLALYHYHAIPVRVQNGCGGGCTYCDFYQNRKIEILPLEKVLKQIDQTAEYLGEEVDHFEQVVLIDGDALTVPTEQLAEEIRYARNKFGFRPDETAPRPWNFAQAFARYKSILAKSEEELAHLREQGLHYLNMGLETGCKELVQVVKPGQELDGFREAVRRLVNVDIKVSINIIVGLGGKKFADRHVNETAGFLQTLPPEITVFYAYLERKATSRYAQQENLLAPLETGELIKQAEVFRRLIPKAYKYLFIPM